jgi:transcription elongation GreA/GreB family factor
VNETGIILALPDYRKLSGIVAAWKAKRRPFDAPMKKIDNDLRTARVVDPDALPADTISIGSLASVQDTETGESLCVRLVFPADLDGTECTASIFSPLGAAIIGETVGSIVRCEAPTGVREFCIMAVQAASSVPFDGLSPGPDAP